MKLSVCIPTYNRAGLLRRALASVLAQGYADLEIVISDNCSLDEHWQAAQALARLDARIRLQRNPDNLGWAGNLNSCLPRVTGEAVLFLADDDELLPGMLAQCALFLAAHPAAGLVHTDAWARWPTGRRVRIRTQPEPLLPAGSPALRKILLNNNLAFSSVVVRRACYQQLGGFTDTVSADWEMWARIGRDYALGHVAEPLVQYHLHALSARHPPERYLADWTLLGSRILSYFPSGEQDALRGPLHAEVANGLFSLGTQAWRQGEWRRGWQFLAAARRLVPAPAWARRVARAAALAPARRLQWGRAHSGAHESHV